jgi:SNF2 family DNA or RNA helicase
MIILHGGFYRDRLVIWGEVPVNTPADKVRKKRKSDLDRVYPYDAGEKMLTEVLKKSFPGCDPGPKSVEVWDLWVPTVNDRPMSSSPIIAENPELKSPAELEAWKITGVSVSKEKTVDLLCGCVGREVLGAGVVVGKDLSFWAKVLRFAGSLVTRQQVVPGVVEEAGVFRSCWRPVFSGSDAHMLSSLAQAMPGVARALTKDPGTASGTTGTGVTRDFISTFVDFLVRSTPTEGVFTVPAAGLQKKGKKKTAAFDSLHDQWLYSLRTEEGVLEGEARELNQFADQVRQWCRQISMAVDSPLRLCFRLEEPAGSEDEEGKSWFLRYLLQSAADPSLLIPADEAWKAQGKKAAIFDQLNVNVKGFNVREYLLLSLGQASGIYPRLEAGLKESKFAGFELETAGAYEFLTEKAMVLEQGGFGMILPAWWTRKGTKVRLTARAQVKSPKMQGGGKLSLSQVVQFDWQVALGGEVVTREELEALAKLKVPLVRFRGQWVQMTAEDIQAALDYWKGKNAESGTVRDVVRMALGQVPGSGGLGFEAVSADGWIGEFLSQLEGRANFEELAAPPGFQGTLRPYQNRGFSWLAFLKRWGLGSCLADDMGLGKTIQALTLIARDWEEGDRRPILLICPMSVVGNWQKEAARFTPGLPVMVHHGGLRTKGNDFLTEAGKNAIVISSYALLHRDFEIIKQVDWAGVVLDEAQNIKNAETRQAKAARSIKGDYRIALTGTPVENNVGDLWSVMEFLNPGFLGTQAEFKRNFFIPIQAYRDAETMGRLKKLTGPFILRRLKTDKSIIADLPEKNEMKVFCNLTKEQGSLYAAVVKEASDALEGSDGIQRKGVILATLSKLKQVCNHPAQFLGDNSSIPDRSGKLSRLTEMLEEVIEEGDRTLIFTQFSEMGTMLQKYLQETFGQEVLFLQGGTLKKKRDAMVERFQSGGSGPRIFILSLKAGGTGLNLTGANHVFHFDRWWNPAVENQATDRAFRIGQTKNVQVHKYVCIGTLEEKIDEMIEGKKEVAEKVVGTGEGWLTELSNKELKELFALRKEAVES